MRSKVSERAIHQGRIPLFETLYANPTYAIRALAPTEPEFESWIGLSKEEPGYIKAEFLIEASSPEEARRQGDTVARQAMEQSDLYWPNWTSISDIYEWPISLDW